MSNFEKELNRIDEFIKNNRYKDNWESLCQYEMPTWFKKSRLGIFSHWGVFSVPEYFSEWYSRLMYHKMNPVYWHHKKTYGKDFQYRQFIDMFKGEKFNPDEWVKMIKDIGADYYSPVGEHHDGFKLYNSDLTKWNSVNMGVKRDVLAELKEACEKNDLIFGTSNHRAEHFWFLNGMRTLNKMSKKEMEDYPDLYGECFNNHKINNILNAVDIGGTFSSMRPTKEWCEEWLVHCCEMIDKYQPAILYFDWWLHLEEWRPYVKKFMAYYYNRSLEWGKEVCVTYKRDTLVNGCSVYDRERGQLPTISQRKWQCDTSTAYNAWNYCTNNHWKSPLVLADTFIDVVSKNGVLFLNICPKADGSYSKGEKILLKKFGEWNKIHKEALWDTEPYRIYGEGKAKNVKTMQEWKSFTKKDYRFLYKPGHIFAFSLIPNKQGRFCIKSFRLNNTDEFGMIVKDVKVVGGNGSVAFEQTKKGLMLQTNFDVDISMPICFDIIVD